jgi:ATP-binding cassette subfamily G (WHITE) protein 2 (PDR)
MLCDMPAKLGASLGFNVTVYFMTNLNRSAEAFFTFWILSFSCLLAMSMFFRCQGSLGRTHDQIMVPIGMVIMLCITYAGFIIPVPYMKPWLSWFRRIDPVAYTFESLIINEVSTMQSSTSFIDTLTVPTPQIPMQPVRTFWP